MLLNLPSQKNFSEVDSIGVALTQNREGQNHIAILFELDDEMALLHVGEYKGKLCDRPTDKYIWMELGEDFHPVRKQVMLSHLLQIVQVNQGLILRYGLDHSVNCFNPETGKINDCYDFSVGFTCATFVLEVFLSFGFELIDVSTWPPADEQSINFQKMVFTYLHGIHIQSPHLLSTDYLNAQLSNIGKSRFLPQEVAAATQNGSPSIKSEIDPVAIEIHDGLTKYTKEYYAA